MNATWIKEMARKLVQNPPDPENPGVIEAKRYVMFDDAVAALTEAYEAGEIATKEKAAQLANSCAEILPPEHRVAATWIGDKIRALPLSGAEESKK